MLIWNVSALIAISEFRNIDFVQFLLAADNLDSENHEGRAEEQKENYIMNVIDIALETALKIQKRREQNIVK